MSANKHAELRPKCGGCGARISEKHVQGCDVARCLSTGMQHWVCDREHEGKCKRDVWTGLWPGTAECIEFGWYAVFQPGHGGWVRAVGSTTPGAVPDLNRVMVECVWDADARRWQQR